MPQNESDRRPHFLISDTAHTEPYTPVPSRGKTFKLPPRERRAHGQKLLRQFDRLREETDTVIADWRPLMNSGPGLIKRRGMKKADVLRNHLLTPNGFLDPISESSGLFIQILGEELQLRLQNGDMSQFFR